MIADYDVQHNLSKGKFYLVGKVIITERNINREATMLRIWKFVLEANIYEVSDSEFSIDHDLHHVWKG